MRPSRRELLIGGSGVLVATALGLGKPSPLLANPLGKPIGLELYTVGADLDKDYDGTLRQIAAIGYKEVEFAGYFNHSPKDVRASLDKEGLSAPSVHVSIDIVRNHLPEAIEAAKIIGHKYIVCPWIDEADRKSPDGYKTYAESFNKAGETCKKAGIQFAYHNHNFEFSPAASLNASARSECGRHLVQHPVTSWRWCCAKG